MEKREEVTMKYRYVADSHVHTDCSRDAADPAMMMCESATRLGLYALTVTDHCECNAFFSEEYDKSVVQSYFEAKKAAAVFGGRLHVYAGVELGQPMQDSAAAGQVLDSCGFDFALASVHNIKNKRDFFELDYSTENIEDLLERYFDEIMETIEWGRFDSIAHLTYPWRYIVGEHRIAIPEERWKKRIDEVLKALIRKGKALEVNTSGFRQKLGVSMPDLPVLQRYRELGGKLVTLGSDAHRWADVGAGIEQGLDVLRKAGFHHFMIYVSHKPKALPIG
jgi:histidinol-phosphatase (PHP family)